MNLIVVNPLLLKVVLVYYQELYIKEGNINIIKY